MKIPNWAFALLRFGVVGLIYHHFAPRYGIVAESPLLQYGLPAFMLLAVLGVHRYWMFALGVLIIGTTFTNIAPESYGLYRFKLYVLGLTAFFIGFTPCDRDYSVRAMWNRRRPEFFTFRSAPEFTWTLYRLFVSLLYARYLIARTSADFFEGDFLARMFVIEFPNSPFLYASWFGGFAVTASVILWALNAVVAVGVWSPRAFSVVVIAGALFNGALLALSGFENTIHFVYLLLLLPFAVYGLEPQTRTSSVLTST